MRVLLVHEYYQQPGGEDAVFAAVGEILRRFGHEVAEYTLDNRQLRMMPSLAAAARAIWSLPAQRGLSALIASHRPEVAHFHNTFPLISPAAYYSCRRRGVAVVQTLHNYRLLCPEATFYRGGRTCTDCLARAVAWPGVLHGCYRRSRAGTAAVALMLAVHRGLGTYRRQIDRYIALSRFSKALFVRGGLPASKIRVRPNFLQHDPGIGSDAGGYALYVGRLSEQKGIRGLLAAWRELEDVPLKIVGDGPLAAAIRGYARGHPELPLTMLGWRPLQEVMGLLKAARFLLFPSEGLETFGQVIIEAFACGVPIVASGQGIAAELVRDGVTGLCFQRGRKGDLAAKARWLWQHPADARRMGGMARAEYDARYSAEASCRGLLEVYQQAIRQVRRPR